MAKSKSKSEIEHLRGIIKQLKKEIKRQEKREHQYKDLEQKQEELALLEEMNSKSEAARCPNCQGILKIIDLNIRKLITCDNCNYREVKKSEKVQ